MIRSRVVLPVPFGPIERGLGALADPEGDLVEQRPPVGQDVAHLVEVEMAHEQPLSGTPRVRAHGYR